MRLSGADVAVIAILVTGLFVGAYFYTGAKPRAKSVTSIDRIQVVNTKNVGWHKFENGWYNKKVEGKWLVSLTVNRPAKFSFVVNKGEGVSTEEAGVRGPEGSRVVSTSSVSVEFEKGIPYYVSSLRQEAFKFSDQDTITASLRYFPYLTMGEGGWKYFLAPYDVTYKKDGTVVEQKTIVYGPGSGDFDWTTGQTYSIGGMTFTNLGTLRGYSTGPPDRRYALVRDEDSTGEKVYRLSDLRNHLKNYGPPHFWNPCTKYREFWRNIIAYGNKPISEAPEAQRIKSVAGLYEDLNNYPEEVDSWYSANLPYASDYESKHPSAEGTKAWPYSANTIDDALTSFTLTHKYGLLKAGPVSGFPRVNVEAPASKFDTVVWYPPSGDAKILSVSDVTVDEQGRGTITIEYKNTGETPATFHVSCDAPSVGSVLNLPPNRTLNPGETTTQTIVLSGATVKESRTQTGSVTVTATRTGNSDTASFTMTVRNVEGKPGPGPGETGDITGVVIDKSTGKPIAGAKVYTGTGQVATTGGDGKFTIEDAPAGQTVRVTATAPGYQKRSKEVNVIAEKTVTVGTIYLKEKGGGLPWLWIGIGAAIASIMAVVLIVMREKRMI